MARWIAILDDQAEAITRPIREQHAQDHFEYLMQHKSEIKIAGGLWPEEGDWYSGGLWILEVQSRARAVKICEDDPYFKLGLRKGYKLFRWGKAPCYGEVVL